VLAAGAVAPAAALSATITVNDGGDALANDGKCMVREAVKAANTDTPSGAAAGECPAGSGADTIAFAIPTATLAIAGVNEDANATGDLDVLAELTFKGAGAGSTTIAGGKRRPCAGCPARSDGAR